MSQITCNFRPRRSHGLYTIFLLDGAGKRQLRFAQRPGSWRFPAGGQKKLERRM